VTMPSAPDVAGSPASPCWMPADDRKVAALFVQEGGCYYGLPFVVPYPLNAQQYFTIQNQPVPDARQYAGPWPVVAHPPCQRWGRLGLVNWHRWGGEQNRPGNDGGCFESALRSVRIYGGILEHPAGSMAWDQFGLSRPHMIDRGWTPCAPMSAGRAWTCEVWQSAYGHKAAKATWLYYVGRNRPAELDWARPKGTHQVGFRDYSRPKSANKPTLSKRDANATPIMFRDVLLSLASNSIMDSAGRTIIDSGCTIERTRDNGDVDGGSSRPS
jgi:hypothetical protein